jgi:hypothetical protein
MAIRRKRAPKRAGKAAAECYSKRAPWIEKKSGGDQKASAEGSIVPCPLYCTAPEIHEITATLHEFAHDGAQ